MGLYRRGSTWTIQFFANGKRVREAIGPSKRQAELVLAKRKTAVREGKYFEAPKDSTLAVGALLKRYLQEHAALHLKPRTHARYVEAAKVLRARFGERLVKDVRPEDVHHFLLER